MRSIDFNNKTQLKNKVTLIVGISSSSVGGIERYTYELRKRIPTKYIDMTPVLGTRNLEIVLSILYRRRKYLYKKHKLLSEVNHFLQPELFYNINKGKKIVTVHDLIILKGFSDVKNVYDLGRKLILTKNFKDALNNADFFIAVSNQTKSEIKKYGIEDDKIEVINLGVDEKFKIKKEFEERENFIGYLGSFVSRKRVQKLILDFHENLKHRGFKLVLGGSGKLYKKVFRKYNEIQNVEFKGYIPEEKIVDFYNSLKAFVFPTKYEGFGLPIIEAVASGTPCFIYKDAKISEEVRKYAIEIENVGEIPEILEEITSSKLRKLSKKVKKDFNWNKTIKKTIRVYRRFV